MIVSEPEPGQVLAETDKTTGAATHFIVDPLEDGQKSHVTIQSDVPVRSGLIGWVERLMGPPLIKRIYRKELHNLNQYARQIADQERQDLVGTIR